jgi:hypothetical protein
MQYIYNSVPEVLTPIIMGRICLRTTSSDTLLDLSIPAWINVSDVRTHKKTAINMGTIFWVKMSCARNHAWRSRWNFRRKLKMLMERVMPINEQIIINGITSLAPELNIIVTTESLEMERRPRKT